MQAHADEGDDDPGEHRRVLLADAAVDGDLDEVGHREGAQRDDDHGHQAEDGAAPVRVGEAREPGELELAREVHEGAPALEFLEAGAGAVRAGGVAGGGGHQAAPPGRRPAGAGRPPPARRPRRGRSRSAAPRRGRTCARTGRPAAISSSCVPRSSMRPLSITTISSASEMVLGRWAMMNVVRPCVTSCRARRILNSVSTSTLEVASSRMRMRGSMTSARAMAMRWRCPPLSVKPRSPMTVS